MHVAAYRMIVPPELATVRTLTVNQHVGKYMKVLMQYRVVQQEGRGHMDGVGKNRRTCGQARASAGPLCRRSTRSEDRQDLCCRTRRQASVHDAPPRSAPIANLIALPWISCCDTGDAAGCASQFPLADSTSQPISMGMILGWFFCHM